MQNRGFSLLTRRLADFTGNFLSGPFGCFQEKLKRPKPDDQGPQKYIEQWWRKYEAMNELEAELPPAPRELVFELMNSVHRAHLNSGNLSFLAELDIEHHIAMQKFFTKWREVHDEKI